jgi:type VI secretion system protein
MRRSFLDKFKGREAGQLGSRHSLENVMRNIQAVLNTKEGFGSFRHDFGLGAYTAKFGARDLLKTLTEEMHGEIIQHEPRISGVKLELLGKDNGLMLHFQLTGIVNDEPCKLRLLFHTVSGNVQVEQSP